MSQADIAYTPRRPSPLATAREFRLLLARNLRARLTPPGPASHGPVLPGPASHGPASHNAEGAAVLVIPTLFRDDRQTLAMRAALSAQGYAAFGWELGRDMGPTPELMAGVEARLLDLARRHGPVAVIGLSMGGLFARWLALEHPAEVRQVITVCTPFRAAFDSFYLPRRFLLKIWPSPGLPALARELERPLPVPSASLFSRRDGIVAWESCCDWSRPEECFEVASDHVMIAINPRVWSVVLEQLARQNA